KRHGQIHPQIVAVAGVIGVGRHRYAEQHIAARAAVAALAALSAQPDLLCVAHAHRYSHIHFTAVRQEHAPRAAVCRLLEADRDRDLVALADARAPAATTATPPAAQAAAEQIGKDVLGAKSLGGFAAFRRPA